LWKKIGKEDGISEKTGAKAAFKHLLLYFRVTKILTKAHVAAYYAMKEIMPSVRVGVVKHVHYFHGHNGPQNVLLAKVMVYFQSLKYLNKIIKHCDEIGLNYYRNTGYGEVREYKLTDMGWKIAPEFIYQVLLLLQRYNKPIYIAEAGLADADDSDRAEYITKQVEATWQAIQDGVDVRGHMYWSLLDNYEWALGYEKRFGLVEIDYETLKRKIRPSAYVYKKICEQNAVE
jgi:beta-glucosidase/6-phospho-beta-glucosidase/beta-galactosidase